MPWCTVVPYPSYTRILSLSLLQFGNMVLLIAQVYEHFIPSFWIIMVIIIWEGLLGGSAYVNTFYKIREEVSEAFVIYILFALLEFF